MNNRIKTLLREQLQTIGEEMTGGFRAYHGTETKIEKFTDEFVGGKDAIDQNGPGIYFTSTHDEAMRYTSNEGGFIYSVRLESGKYLDSEERSAEYLSQYRDDLVKLVKMAPEWEMNAYDWSQDPETGVEIMVDSAIEYNDNEKDVFLQIWIEAYRHKEVHFVRNMSKLGYSGIFVPADKANNNGNHIIVFNPATITVEDVEVIGSETNENVLTENEPLVLPIMKNMESAPNMGSRFGQDVEPAGTYVSHFEDGDTPDMANYKYGKAIINKPLFIDVDDNNIIQYKRDLAAQYKAKGKKLTQKLMQQGYDALITKRNYKGSEYYGEIVLFPNAQFMLN